MVLHTVYYISVFTHCFDFIPATSLAFHILTIFYFWILDARSLFHKGLNVSKNTRSWFRKHLHPTSFYLFVSYILSIANIYQTQERQHYFLLDTNIIFLENNFPYSKTPMIFLSNCLEYILNVFLMSDSLIIVPKSLLCYSGRYFT